MARNRPVLIVLISSAATCALFAQEPPKEPNSAPKFDLPLGRPGGPPPTSKPDGERRDWRERHGGKPGEPGRPPMPPEAQAMRDHARKEFEKMTPEQREKFWSNFKTWIDMPTEQRERFTKMHDDRFQKARTEIQAVISKSGLTLDEEQKKKFAGRYFEERKLIEETLRAEFDERRRPLVTAMEEKLKAEFSKPASSEQPK